MATDETDELLSGGWQTDVRRIGDAVHRSASPWSRSVIDLLRHLDAEGFRSAPRPIGKGFDPDGNEMLTFMPGESLQPAPWSDEAIGELGEMVAEFHAAAASFRPASAAVWKDWFGRTLGGVDAGFGHGDLGPWNILAIDGRPASIIDWDTAGPLDPVSDLAQAAWLNAQLHDDALAERLGLGDAEHRARQVGIFLDGYGLERARRVGFVDRMIEMAVHSAATEVREHDITADTTTGVAADGYPFAWGMAWRIGGASWMLRNRHVLERGLGIL